jgi:hypothetical protein
MTRRDADFRELLIDCEEDRTLRAVLIGRLRETRMSLGRPTSPVGQRSVAKAFHGATKPGSRR